MVSPDLALRVSRAIKASLDAEGVDFVTAAQDEALHFNRLRQADKRFQRENPDLMDEIRAWYLANYAPLGEDATNEFMRPDDLYLARFLLKNGPWWEILRESDGLVVEVPPSPEETDEPRAWEPQAWWDSLDAQVAAALLVVQDGEGVRPGEPDLYERSKRVVRRFATEYPELAAALADRYAPLDDDAVSAEEADIVAIGLWITENAVGEPFVPRGGGEA